jgi:ribosomal protein S18 acetylase RimI-like enzyme
VPRASDASPPPRIEAASTRDAAALARLAAQALPDAWSEQGFAQEIGTPVARVWIARGPDGEPIGYLVAHVVGAEIQVLSLAVDARHRRRGIGRGLMEHALGQEPAASVVHLEVRSNDAGAQAFYAGLDFHPVGRRPGFYPGGVDAVSLTRVLRDPPWS